MLLKLPANARAGKPLLTSSSEADLLGPTTAFVLSAFPWVPGLRMPETHDMSPPLEDEATGFFSAGALEPNGMLVSGRWMGLKSGVEVWERTP